MVSGTVLPGRSVKDVKLDEVRFELEQFSSSASLLRRGESLVLDVRVNASEPISLSMEFAGPALQFDAITQMDGELDAIEIADQVIRIDALSPHIAANSIDLPIHHAAKTSTY